MAPMRDPEAATLLGGSAKAATASRSAPRSWKKIAAGVFGALALGGGVGALVKARTPAASGNTDLVATAARPAAALPEFLKDLTADEVSYCACGVDAAEKTTACCAVEAWSDPKDCYDYCGCVCTGTGSNADWLPLAPSTAPTTAKPSSRPTAEPTPHPSKLPLPAPTPTPTTFPHPQPTSMPVPVSYGV